MSDKPKLTVIEGGKKEKQFEDLTFDDLLDPKANGGTEIQARKLFSNFPELVREFNWVLSYQKIPMDPKKPSILWMHETPFDEGVRQAFKDPNYHLQFNKIVFVSYWQQQLFHALYNIPWEQSIVIGNSIDPVHVKEGDFQVPSSRNVTKLVYISTPHRGLDILLDVIQSEEFENRYWELHVCSSFELYNRKENDVHFQKLFDRCKEDDRIKYHGTLPNDRVLSLLKESHILAYPSTYMETSCISAMEAMSTMCAIVCPNYGALPETTANYSFSYSYEPDPERHKVIFSHVLKDVIDNWSSNNVMQLLQYGKVYCDTFYRWDVRLQVWKQLLEGVYNLHYHGQQNPEPTPEAV